MLVLALAELRSRPAAYIGSFLAVAFGVALVSSCGLLLATSIDGAAGTTGEARREWTGAIGVFSSMLAVAAFAGVFVVASTFAFAAALRRRKLALLRMIGATPRQVRRMLHGEALAVSITGGAVGSAAGVPVAYVFAEAFQGSADFPADFAVRPTLLPIAIALAVGVVVGQLAAATAARPVARIDPAEALRATIVEPRGIGLVRLLLGVASLGGGITLLLIGRSLEGGVSIGIAFMDTCLLIVAVALLGPLPVMPLIRLLGLVLAAAGPLAAQLATANAVAMRRRTASVVAPVVLLVALPAAMLQTASAFSEQVARGEENVQLWSLSLIVVITVGFTAIAISALLAMSLSQRAGELRSLRLAGATPAQVRGIMRREGAAVTLAGTAIGLAIAAASVMTFQAANGLPADPFSRPAVAVGLAGGAAALVLGATELAARHALAAA